MNPVLRGKSAVTGTRYRLSLLLVAGLLGCDQRGSSPDPDRRTGPPTDTATTQSQRIVAAQFGDLLLYLPLYIAKHEGVFARNGLDVTIVSTGGDEKTYAAVLAGDAQFGIADPTFVALAAARGQSGKVIGLLIDGVPNFGVSVKPNAQLIRSPSDLAGKTVASVPAPSTSYALMSDMYRRAGLRPSIHQVAFPGLVPALRADAADYAVLIEPWVSQVVAEGGTVGFSMMDQYPHFALTGVTTSVQTLGANPEVVQRFLNALTEGVRIFYQDEEAAFRAARKQFPQEPEAILRAAVARHRQARIHPDCLVMTEAAWAPAIRLRQDTGDLEGAAAPLSTYVDTVAARRACARR